MTPRASIFAASAALIFSPALRAEQPALPQNAPTNSDIVVKGTTAHAIDTYVRQITASGDRGQLARWNRLVCLRIINLDPPHAKIIEERLAAVGDEAGVKIAAEPCKANVLIIATT
jgi:hypothetical protein